MAHRHLGGACFALHRIASSERNDADIDAEFQLLATRARATQRAAASSENDATTAAADASPKEDVTDGVCLFGDDAIAVAAAAAATPGSRIAPKPALFTRTLALACPVPAFYPHTLDARLPAI